MLALCSVVLMTYFAQNYAGIKFACLRGGPELLKLEEKEERESDLEGEGENCKNDIFGLNI